MPAVHRLTALELVGLLARGELSPGELRDHYLSRIQRYNPKLSCYLHVASEALSERYPGPLYGLPVAFKDLTPVAGMPCTSGSLLHQNELAEQDAVVVERARQAGGVVLGKTNTPEFGFKAVTDNQLAPPCRNPWNLARTSGGSSGGAACAVAAGLTPLAEGTDGAGSIRIPASYCGVVGHKPSRGLIPRYPVPDAFYTLSHIGPIARNVADCAFFLGLLAGYDERDPLSLNQSPIDYLKDLERPPELRMGWSPDLGYARVSSQVLDRLEPAVRSLGDVVPLQLDWPDPEPLELDLWALTYAGRLLPDERLDPELRKIVQRGLEIPARRPAQVSQERTAFYHRVRRVFEQVDILLTPTMPTGAFPIELQRPTGCPTLFGWTPFTYPFNLTGNPALTVPVALDGDGMPLSLQIVGRPGADRHVLRLGRVLEQQLSFSNMLPLSTFP